MTGLRARYEILDGLRGVAAIGVLFFHLSIVGVPYIARHGYLAVDFFFLLSGFVLSHSYQDRLATMPFAEFFRLRIIRIFPLCTIGLIFGTLYFILRYYTQRESQYTLGDILIGAFFNLCLLPKPWQSIAPTDTIFPSDTPLWSLSIEMAVNLIWAFAVYRARTRTLIVVILLSGVTAAYSIITHGSADLGATWPTYLGGVSRAVFGFFAGVLIWRYRPVPDKTYLLTWISSILLMSVLVTPNIVGAPGDLVAIFLVFPLILYAAVSADFRVEQRVFAITGSLSYPLYVIHVPILMFFVGMTKSLHFGFLASPTGVIFLLIVCIIFATVLDMCFDRPIRRIIMRRG